MSADGFRLEHLKITVLAFVFGGLWGYLFSGWFKPIKNEKWLVEPYVATPIVILLTAICSMTFMGVETTTRYSFTLTALMEALIYGVLGGIIGFIYTFAISVPVGLLTGKLLYPVLSAKNPSNKAVNGEG